MTHKSMSQLFRIIVDVARKEKHDGQPYIIWGYLQVAMPQISLKKSRKKARLRLFTQRAALTVIVNDILFCLPKSLTIDWLFSV